MMGWQLHQVDHMQIICTSLQMAMGEMRNCSVRNAEGKNQSKNKGEHSCSY